MGKNCEPGALIVVDLQSDFLPGGSLAVPGGEEVIDVLNGYIDTFVQREWPIFATRDWHPPNHCSFKAQGGLWPEHCVMNTPGARFSPALRLPAFASIISKGTDPTRDAYSGFEGTDLEERLRKMSVPRLYVGGLATDYCVLNTVKDGLQRGFEVKLLEDAIRAVNVKPGDGSAAIKEMVDLGAIQLERRERMRAEQRSDKEKQFRD